MEQTHGICLGTSGPLAAISLSRLNFSHLPETPWWGYYLQLSVFHCGWGKHSCPFRSRLLATKRFRCLAPCPVDNGNFYLRCHHQLVVNGRSILPMAPAAGIVVMRFLRKSKVENLATRLQTAADTVILCMAGVHDGLVG